MDAFHLSTLVQNINVLLHKVDSEGKTQMIFFPMTELSVTLLQITLCLREERGIL